MYPQLTLIAVEERHARLRADYAASRRNAAAWRAYVLRLRRVLGWALVDAGIRIAAGRDENVSSHIALANGFPFLIEDEDRELSNESAQHIDFMIGSDEMEVDGVTADGERIPVLRHLDSY